MLSLAIVCTHCRKNDKKKKIIILQLNNPILEFERNLQAHTILFLSADCLFSFLFRNNIAKV